MGNRGSFYTAVPFARALGQPVVPKLIQASSMIEAVSSIGLLLVDFLHACRLPNSITVDLSICCEGRNHKTIWLVAHGDMIGTTGIPLKALYSLLYDCRATRLPEVPLLGRKYIVYDVYSMKDVGGEPTRSMLKRLLRRSTTLTSRHLKRLLLYMGARVHTVGAVMGTEYDGAVQVTLPAVLLTASNTRAEVVESDVQALWKDGIHEMPSLRALRLSEMVRDHMCLKQTETLPFHALYAICKRSLLYGNVQSSDAPQT